MALQDLLNLASNNKKLGISEERIEAIIPVLRQYASYWREYPDMFIDFLQGGIEGNIPKDGLKFYFYQRVFLRATMRYKYVYMVYPRAYSKSFLSILVLMCRCILYPGAHLFVTSGGKEQAAGIAKEKVQEICKLVPAIEREIDWRRGKTQEGKDYCKYMFKNGSWFDNVAARESSRGKRRHGGLIEECVGVDGTILNEVIVPTMNIDRRCADGNAYEQEVLNKSQIYVTTAGWKNTFAYDKLIQLLIRMVLEPEKSIVMGGTWRIPVAVGLQSRNFVSELKQDGTFNDASFSREYESEWSGTVEDAFFNGDIFDRNRKLQQAETEYSGRSSANAYYVLSVDVGRKGCDTVVCVFKVTPQAQGPAIKSLVNIYTCSEQHFGMQAAFIKSLYFKYKARTIVIDGNGLGIGLIDYMVQSSKDYETGEEYPSFGIENDEEGFYKKFRADDTILDAIYIIKANAPINTEAHANAQSQLRAGRVKLLVDEKIAKNKLLDTAVGKKMKPEERAQQLMPFTLTSVLREEMLNLREENEGVNIILKQANKSVPKDKFSAFEYGLYYIKLIEDSKRKRRKKRFSDFMFMSG